MKAFSVYDREKLFEQVVKKEEFSGILFVNIHYYEHGETHEVHKHDDHEEIFICFQGKGVAITESGDREFHKGDVLVFKPYENHGFRSDEVDPLAYLCIAVKL